MESCGGADDDLERCRGVVELPALAEEGCDKPSLVADALCGAWVACTTGLGEERVCGLLGGFLELFLAQRGFHGLFLLLSALLEPFCGLLALLLEVRGAWASLRELTELPGEDGQAIALRVVGFSSDGKHLGESFVQGADGVPVGCDAGALQDPDQLADVAASGKSSRAEWGTVAGV